MLFSQKFILNFIFVLEFSLSICHIEISFKMYQNVDLTETNRPWKSQQLKKKEKEEEKSQSVIFLAR